MLLKAHPVHLLFLRFLISNQQAYLCNFLIAFQEEKGERRDVERGVYFGAENKLLAEIWGNLPL